MPTWLEKWTPEDPVFWRKTGSKIAWQTLIITTIALTLSFATWFVMSAVAVRLPQVGFKFTTSQLYWLAAMPGLAGGTLRIVNVFLIPVYGSRHVITIATLLKLIPCIGLGLAVSNPETPYWLFVVLAFSVGLGGGDFSSFMPSTSLFFPKRLQGTALGVQAGVGNFGVSLAQFVTPWIIGVSALGAMAGPSQTMVKGTVTRPVWLQTATYWYVPFLAIVALLAWTKLRSVPVKASFREQLDIFGKKHTWIMTSLYVMTFGSFAGFAATFPLLIKSIYGKFPGAPDPLTFAFLGPLVGSAARVLGGPPSDKWGGAIITQIAGVGLIACAIGVTFFVEPTSLDEFPWFVALMLGLFLFSGIGNASTFRQMPVIFAGNPRQAAGVLGWTSAVAAYGPFAFAALFGWVITRFGSPKYFFFGAAVFYALNVALNWFYYKCKNAEVPC